MTISKEQAKMLLIGVQRHLELLAPVPEMSPATSTASLGGQIAQAAEDRRQHGLRQVRLALQRLEAGEFGYCMSCGDEISLQRLTVNPLVATCEGCAIRSVH